MVRALPYFAALAAGIWGSVFASHYFPLPSLAIFAAALGGLSAAFGLWAQKVDEKLGELDRIALKDPRVQARLSDRVLTRRNRLVVKRVAITVLGALGLLAGAAVPVTLPVGMMSALVLVGLAGGSAAFIGSILVIIEATKIDSRVSEIRRYAEKLKAGEEQAHRLHGAT